LLSQPRRASQPPTQKGKVPGKKVGRGALRAVVSNFTNYPEPAAGTFSKPLRREKNSGLAVKAAAAINIATAEASHFLFTEPIF